MSRPTLMIYDFDGTIADVNAVATDIANKVLKQHHLPTLSQSDFDKLRAMSASEIMKQFKIPLYKIPSLTNALRTTLKEHIDEIEPVRGMKTLLRDYAAHPDVELAVLSTNSTENIEHFLDKHQLRAHFVSVQGGVGLFSKYTRIRRISRSKLGAGKQVLSIGDELRDVEAARIAKVPAIAVDWGLSARIRLEQSKADHIVSNTKELRLVLDGYIAQTSAN